MLWILHAHLPAEAWQGIGTLAATWTGGSLNMLAVRAILNVPDAIFTPLVVVDALIAYSWMACLIWCKGIAPTLARWLRAPERYAPLGEPRPFEKGRGEALQSTRVVPWHWRAATGLILLSVGLSFLCWWIARSLPLGGVVTSQAGWTILLVSSAALVLSCVPVVRRLGEHGASVGYPCLYLVLASLGAQASLKALTTTPVWILVGVGMVLFHAVLLLLAGRMFRLPLGVLATASQANVGGVVSAPLVGAVYNQSLAPIGLCLAIAGNAVGTYLGVFAALITRTALGGG
jgi:uncharacterized membrane protein